MATYFEIHDGFIIALFYFCFISSDTKCSSNTFGPNCDFECHCLNNEQCNNSTENCPSGCDFDWVGPACQHRNIVPAGQTDDNVILTRQTSNIPARKIALLAVDRNLSTCSHTNYANISTDIPWWRLWLKNINKIRNISIFTNKDSLDYFKNFEVTVETNLGKYSNGYSSREVCYKHDNSPPTTNHFDVSCYKSFYGNQLRIRLARQDTQLVLCDVKVYGECSDGSFGVNCTEKCSDHCTDVCKKDDGTCSSCTHGWTGHKCNQACDDGKYGENCKSNCSGNCKNNATCNNKDGVCTDGCSPGYKGDSCRQKCDDGYYGLECLQKCSTRCIGGYVHCDNVFGSCLSGCTSGWTGRKCDEACPIGQWGINCAKSCGNCVSDNCRHTDGVCNRGCAAGVKNTPHCDEECRHGTFGINCSGVCSTNCKDVCRKQHGECEYCKSGWQGANCTQECKNGKWGENCKRRCVTCQNETCNRISGACYSQCKLGFKQTEFCDQECNNGWYGLNCSEECSLGCKDVTFCRKTDGSCIECKPELEGKLCDKKIKQVKAVEQVKNIHVSVGGIAAIVVTCIVLIVFSVIVSIFITRKRLHRNRNKFENETATYSNVLASEDRSTVMNTPGTTLSKSNVKMENAYDTLKRTSGTEHTYEKPRRKIFKKIIF